MANFNNSNPLNNGQDNRGLKIQKKKIYHSLLKKPLTMLELDDITGIRRANICRHIKSLLDENKIAVLEQRKCTISGHSKVNAYTANKDLFPLTNQLEMF